MSNATVHQDAIDIWSAGVKAVHSAELVRQHVRISGDCLEFGNVVRYPLTSIRQIIVVGGGKASAGMARGLASLLADRRDIMERLSGWVNVPDNCLAQDDNITLPITLHAGRPAGCNEPTAAGVVGSQRIMELVSTCQPNDLVIVLLSGGASALLPLPVEGVAWEDKLEVTRLLSESGADIHELNCVRKQLSQIKGGRLRQACRADRLVTLTISDVLGDPLDIIGSGPTEENATTVADAWHVLSTRLGTLQRVPTSVRQYLSEQLRRNGEPERSQRSDNDQRESRRDYHNIVIGNNQTAIDAAASRARQLGLPVEVIPTVLREPVADEVGRKWFEQISRIAARGGPWCLVGGGEPTVELAPREMRGLGGRNQQLVLAALSAWLHAHADWVGDRWIRKSDSTIQWSFLSGGTDGEDGPTDAAGAIITPGLVEAVLQSSVQPAQFLVRNDAYRFFEQFHGLIKTGPTHTNVCDLRVALSFNLEAR